MINKNIFILSKNKIIFWAKCKKKEAGGEKSNENAVVSANVIHSLFHSQILSRKRAGDISARADGY